MNCVPLRMIQIYSLLFLWKMRMKAQLIANCWRGCISKSDQNEHTAIMKTSIALRTKRTKYYFNSLLKSETWFDPILKIRLIVYRFIEFCCWIKWFTWLFDKRSSQLLPPFRPLFQHSFIHCNSFWLILLNFTDCGGGGDGDCHSWQKHVWMLYNCVHIPLNDIHSEICNRLLWKKDNHIIQFSPFNQKMASINSKLSSVLIPDLA